jgi:hypothetical protein
VWACQNRLVFPGLNFRLAAVFEWCCQFFLRQVEFWFYGVGRLSSFLLANVIQKLHQDFLAQAVSIGKLVFHFVGFLLRKGHIQS